MTNILSHETLLSLGTVVLAMCIILDVYQAYKRGANWLPGYAVVIYALFLQLVGYLDVQNVSIANTHKDQQLEALISNQVSVDSSRLVLFVFIGYLLPNLASSNGFWTNIAALLTSLSTHIAIELSVALHSRVSKEDKVVKGQGGIWLFVSDFVLLASTILFSFAIIFSIIRGRFIRDNLSSRIPLALESPENNNETFSCQSEMLKSWIVARVSQPEYVLGRSDFSNIVVHVVTFDVVFMGGKVILLRSQWRGPSPLFTIQCILVILGWFAVYYRFLVLVWFVVDQDRRSSGFVAVSTRRLVSTLNALTDKIENLACLMVLTLVSYIVVFSVICIFILGYMVSIAIVTLGSWLVLAITVCPGFCMLFWTRRFSLAPPNVEDRDFPRYREALELVCMPGDDAKRLWAANKSSFDHIGKSIDKAYERGKSCKTLQKVIGSRLLTEHIPASDDVKEILEPLDSVRKYFPLLKDSFRKITVSVLLMDDSVSDDSMRRLKRNIRKAFKEAEKLMDFLDCPDNVGFSLDVFDISNLEAFMLTNDSIRRCVRFNFRESPTVANAVDKLFDEVKNKLEMCNLLGDVNSKAVNTEWDDTAEAYAVYKVCKLIKDRQAECESVKQLQRYLIDVAADLIAVCIRESPKILVERSRKWAAKFEEAKISAAIELAGFACGVIDGIYGASSPSNEGEIISSVINNMDASHEDGANAASPTISINASNDVVDNHILQLPV